MNEKIPFNFKFAKPSRNKAISVETGGFILPVIAAILLRFTAIAVSFA